MVDGPLAVIVCALAFLLASTPARNSDLWLHLASGRSLARGQSPLGADPFASTTAGVFWVNHTWLSDVILYELHELGGGRALVVAKCLLVTVLAAFFFAFRRRGARVGIVAFAATVAVLALGPWLLLQPVLLSLLGVVLTLYLLERPSLLEGERAERARTQRWLLVPLFALWANLDGWFLLGPVLVGLYALGEMLLLKKVGSEERGVRRTDRFSFSSLLTPHSSLLTLFCAGLAACLLTPYHYHTFAWPTPLGLSHAERAWMRDPLGQGLVVSPFAAPLATAPALASPGGWAYCLLLAAGAASFILCGRALHLGRLLAWLALTALSLYQARAIPFFAVAAGPLLALNLQEWALGSRGSRIENRGSRRSLFRSSILDPRSSILGAGAAVGLILLVLAWPGWLQPAPHRLRGWGVERDDSLVRMAGRLAARQGGPKSQPGHAALTFSPEAAHYLAWYCPAEKGFLDSRWPLFDRVAEDYVQIRRCLLQPDASRPDPRLGPLLDTYGVDRILLYDPDWGRTTRASRCLLGDEQEWELLAVEGGAALFGRRSGEKSPSPETNSALQRAAYHPEPEHRAPLTAPRAPQPPGLFDPFYRARDERSADRSEAALYLLTFDLLAQRRRAEREKQWLLAQAAGLTGSGPGSETAGTAAALAVRLSLTFLVPRVSGPPEALLPAVRAARRALSANPDDAGAYLLLGGAYFRLARQTPEQGWQGVLPELAPLRRAQALTALEQAVLLRPDLDEAHALLAQLYSEGRQLDRTLDHLRARLRIAEHDAEKGGPGAPAAAERQATLQDDVKALEAVLRHAEDIYEVNTQGQAGPSSVLNRASVAQRHGLSRKALELLLESHPAIFGDRGAMLQLDLMLGAGRAFEVRDWLEPGHEAVLGFQAYHSYLAWAAAACGDYAGADAELDQLGVPLRQLLFSPGRLMPVRQAMALRAGAAVLSRPALGSGALGLAGMAYLQFRELAPLGGPADLLRQEANLEVLRGLLALESGAVETARAHFRAARDVWGSDRRAAAGAGVDFPARPIAQQMIHRLEEAAEAPSAR